MEPNWHVSAHLFGGRWINRGRIFRWISLTKQFFVTFLGWWFVTLLGVKWPLTRGEKGHFESPGVCTLLYYLSGGHFLESFSPTTPTFSGLNGQGPLRMFSLQESCCPYTLVCLELVWKWSLSAVPSKSDFEEASDLTCESDEDHQGIHHL